MEQLIPRTLKRWESYQSNLYKSAVLSKFQTMTRGHLRLTVQGDSSPYSFGYGQKIQADMLVANDRFFTRFLRHGELGFGESYVEGDWDSPDLATLIRWFLLNIDQFDTLNRLDRGDHPLFQFLQGVEHIQALINKARPSGFADVLAGHYELERPFFALMLDPSLTNSGAMFEGDEESLEEAQMRKQRRIARELAICPGDHILEFGSGWGHLALYLALCFPCKVTAVTTSEEQHRYLVQKVRDLQLEGRVQPLLLDYRSVQGSFDRIVSVEMVDALETQELPRFFEQCDSLLKPQGIMLHQLLLSPELFCRENRSEATWVRKYISPGINTPSLSQVLTAMNSRSAFSIRRLEDIGLSYARTLNFWRKRFETNLEQVRALGFDESFIRSWRYYLSYAEAAFDHGLLTAAQLTLTRPTQRSLERKPDRATESLNGATHLD
jgi:cyclopropane-fatty-acyl-phospholipid synthase